jgi:hypothetical protein
MINVTEKGGIMSTQEVTAQEKEKETKKWQEDFWDV